MVYGADVRQRFFAPANAGDIAASRGLVCEGTAEDRSLAVWIRFRLEIQAGKIGRLRFRAFGCPHLLAAADRVAAELEGQPLEALRRVDWQALARALEVPREKFGKLLRIEDALAACYAQAQRF
jgi:NifU-like protein involved in Fe-S cluster formation